MIGGLMHCKRFGAK